MKVEIDCPKVGAGLLATGTVFLNLVNQKTAWWIGVSFMVAGPILMGFPKIKPTRKKSRKI
jgi:hypothetical protein